MYNYSATVLRVVDGDTIWVTVDLGMDTYRTIDIRFYGINAPEKNTDAGKAAKAWLESQLPPGTRVVLDTYKDQTEKYGRYLGIVRLGAFAVTNDGTTVLAGTRNLNQELVDNGMAVPYYP